MLVSKDHAWILYGCKNYDALVSMSMEEVIPKLVADAGFTARGHLFDKFEEHDGQESGYTQFTIIGESGVGTHTWPEEFCVHLNINYCDLSQDNTAKKDALLRSFVELFEPELVEELPMRILPICKLKPSSTTP